MALPAGARSVGIGQRHDHVAIGSKPGEQQPSVQERVVRGDDDLTSPDVAVLGADDARRAGLDLDCPGLLEDLPAERDDALGRGEQVRLTRNV